MRRTLDGDRVANGARADKIDSSEVWGPRFLSIRAGVGGQRIRVTHSGSDVKNALVVKKKKKSDNKWMITVIGNV